MNDTELYIKPLEANSFCKHDIGTHHDHMKDELNQDHNSLHKYHTVFYKVDY